MMALWFGVKPMKTSTLIQSKYNSSLEMGRKSTLIKRTFRDTANILKQIARCENKAHLLDDVVKSQDALNRYWQFLLLG